MTDADLLEQGATLHRAGRYHEAEKIYRRILATDPDQPDALHLLGLLAQEARRPDDAVQLIRRAIELRGDQAAYHLNLGILLQSVGDAIAGEQSLRRAIELQPGFAPAHHHLGEALAAGGKPEQAAQAFRAALQCSPPFPASRERLQAMENLLRPARVSTAAGASRSRFRSSPLWRMQTENYRNAGPDAWRRAEAVPSFASSSASLARAYASMIDAFRRSLPDGHGMLFDFGAVQPITMWMKNTIIPLDMIFLDKDFVIIKIHHNASPFSLKTIVCDQDAIAVLELNEIGRAHV